jgi:S1-C subfamily serine protease
LGSGFYVTGDLVLTNFHVIDGTQFVEIKLFSGLETTGKVIASDPRLDLALVKVGMRGQPVTLYAERTLPLGAEVELIGHPKGLEFSITRGVVSALRELESPNVPGGKKVRFIQTDAAINGGNSGGPMFLGDRVVGVNTLKTVGVEFEGLNFAVHYGEVLEFLARNGVAPGTGS